MAANGAAAAPAHRTWNRVQRILFILAWVVAIAAFAVLVGWDIRGWFQELWDTITSISAAYIVAGCAAETVKTTATAYAWYAILKYAYPGEVQWRQVWAAYATCVGLNFVL